MARSSDGSKLALLGLDNAIRLVDIAANRVLLTVQVTLTLPLTLPLPLTLTLTACSLRCRACAAPHAWRPTRGWGPW